MGEVHVVVGGLFGSESKGATAAKLSESMEAPVAVRVGGPNAGHCVMGVDEKGDTKKWALRQVPVGAVTNPEAALVLAKGSEIDMPVLQSEIDGLDAAGYNVSSRLFIDPQISMIEDVHKELEESSGLTAKLGSTAKGIGAVRAERMYRRAGLYGDGPYAADTTALMYDALEDGRSIICESTQGFGLGLHAGFYPFCTTADVTAVDAMADMGLSPWDPRISEVIPWVVFRPYPIRVAGNSGPLANETSWAELDLPLEHTTVTKKVRRVGHWDPDLAKRAVEANGGSAVRGVMAMLDHRWPELAGGKPAGEALEWLEKVGAEIGCTFAMAGTGPGSYWEL